MLKIGDWVRKRREDNVPSHLGPKDFEGVVVERRSEIFHKDCEYRIMFEYHRLFKNSGGRDCSEDELEKLRVLTVEEMLTHWHHEVRELAYAKDR